MRRDRLPTDISLHSAGSRTLPFSNGIRSPNNFSQEYHARRFERARTLSSGNASLQSPSFERNTRAGSLQSPSESPRRGPVFAIGAVSRHDERKPSIFRRTMSNMSSQRMFLPRSQSKGGESIDEDAPFSPTDLGAYNWTLLQNYRSDLDDEDHDLSARQVIMPASKSGVPLGDRNRPKILQYLQTEEQAVGGVFPWVESTLFQTFVGVVIFTNAIVIGLETDIQTPLWWWVEQVLLVFFCFELSVRLIRHNVNFFQDPDDWVWNVVDFCIVLSGVIDQWLQPILEPILYSDPESKHAGDHERGSMGTLMMLLRMLRLLRIVRLFRLVRIVRPLFELAQGVLEALQGMFWVLVLMVMLLYTIAVLFTRLIGQGAMLGGVKSDPDLMEIRVLFGTVSSSMFALFGSISQWSLNELDPLFKEVPALKPCFILFYVFSGWALLAVMTGVVSENMLAIREQLSREDEAKEEVRKVFAMELLLDCFQAADTDGSGTVSGDEFEAMLHSAEFLKKLTKHTNVRVKTLQELFECLDHKKTGEVKIQDFMSGFKWVNEPLRAKSLLVLQERLSSEVSTVQRGVQGHLDVQFKKLVAVVWAPLRKVQTIVEQMQILDVSFRDVRMGLEDTDRSRGETSLQFTEGRVMDKLSSVLARLDKIEREAGLLQDTGPSPASGPRMS